MLFRSEPREGWERIRTIAAEAMVKKMSDYYDGILEMEIGRLVETPADLCERTGAPNACYWHVDMTPSRSGPNRPAPGLGGCALPVPGLFLGGAGTHPGGGVTGLPGSIAAREVLRTRRPGRKTR